MSTIDIDRTLAALADPHRRRVVDLLRERPRRAGELSASMAMTPPAMSRHLRVLRKAGLVQEDSDETDARVRVYRLKRAPFSALRRWLDDVETFWQGSSERSRGVRGGPAGRRGKRGVARPG